ARTALAGQVDPQPAHGHEQPFLEVDQEVDVGDAPNPPGEPAGEAEPAEVDHRRPAADGGEIALVPIAEGQGLGVAGKTGADHPGRVLAGLLCRVTDARHRLAVRAGHGRCVPYHEDL